MGLGGLCTKVRLGSHRPSDVALLTLQGLCSHQRVLRLADFQTAVYTVHLVRDQVEPPGHPWDYIPQGDP